MILIVNFIALYFAFSLDHVYGVFWGAVLPALYAIVAAPHALLGTTTIPPARIEKILADKWENATDLTKYIVKYWMALSYPATSWKKQRNSVVLYLTSFLVGSICFFRELFGGGLFMFVVGYILYQTSLRVDKPRSVYMNSEFRDGTDNEWARKEWELAAMAIVAFADLYPDDRALRDSATEVSEDRDVKPLLGKYRHGGPAELAECAS
ncbi:MAG: hypothetical protein H0X43_06915 [Nitrosospira sp.]|nr:hypothetical protein [Nitrosospira sp.]